MGHRGQTRRYVSRRLAESFVVGAFNAESLSERAYEILGHRKPWVRKLAENLVARFGRGVRPRCAIVADAILGDGHFDKAWLKESWQVTPRLDDRASMEPVPALLASGVPEIVNVSALAEWLRIPATQLKWLADAGFRERSQTRAKLRHYHYSWRKKQSGSRRLIESPKADLKYVQRRILECVLDRIEAHPAAHGFCRGRSIHSFVTPHVGKSMVLKMDLEQFFTSIRLPRVRAVYRAMGYPDSVASVLAALATNVPPEELWSGPLELSSEERWFYDRPHLPQGAPTSPAMANLCARGLDARLTGLAAWAGADYTRYADDLVFSGGERFRAYARRVLDYTIRIAGKEGFHLNTRKTRLLPASVRQQITGVVVNERPNLRRSEYDALKAVLHNCIRYGPASQNRDSHPAFRDQLLGRIAWVNSLNGDRGQKLREAFERIRWTS